MKSQLLATFTTKDNLDETIEKIVDAYTIIFNKVYVLQNENNVNELICTYNVDTQDGIDYNKVEGTISLHRKKHSNTLYTFTVTVSYITSGFSSSASIQVMTNGPPLLGKVTVNPTTGFEILDKFYFTASKWEDDDLPLSYSYGFYRSDGSKNVLQVKSESNSGSFIFPSGDSSG